MKKLGYIAAALLVSAAFVSDLYAKKGNNGHAVSEKKLSETTIEVKRSQMDTLQNVVKDFVEASQNVSGPEELFKQVSGAIQTNDRETPIVGAINSARANKFSIVCYIEGSDTIVGASDPEMLGKSVEAALRDKAIAELKKPNSNQAVFTYDLKKKVGNVDVVEKRVVAAIGRKAFKSMENAKKKFMVLVSAEIDQ